MRACRGQLILSGIFVEVGPAGRRAGLGESWDLGDYSEFFSSWELGEFLSAVNLGGFY